MAGEKNAAPKQTPLRTLAVKALKNPRKAVDRLSYLATRLVGQEDYAKFVMISRSRTGSNLLVSLLDSHPNVYARHEVFQRLNGRPYKKIWRQHFGKQPYYIKAAGFKIFYYHPLDADCPDLWRDLIADRAIKIIHLTRANILNTLVSRKIAGLTDAWSSNDKSSSADKGVQQISFTPEELSEGFQQTRNWETEFASLFAAHPIYPLTYESLIAHQDEQFRRITEFLGVPAYRPRSQFKKQSKAGQKEIVSNYDELKDRFSKTEWRDFFED